MKESILYLVYTGCGGAAHRVLHQQDDLHKHDEWPVVKFGLISGAPRLMNLLDWNSSHHLAANKQKLSQHFFWTVDLALWVLELIHHWVLPDVHYADAEAGGAKVDYRAGLASLKEAMIQFHDECELSGLARSAAYDMTGCTCLGRSAP